MLILSEFEGVNFFNCYLAAPQPTLGHYHSPDVNHCIFTRVSGSLVTRLGPEVGQAPSGASANTLSILISHWVKKTPF